jgi:hypothetical protein
MSVLGPIDLSDYLEGKELAQATHNLGVPGKVAIVKHIPMCNFCAPDGVETPGPFDFATRMGQWAHGCENHYKLYRAAEGLGVGKAQLWIERDG